MRPTALTITASAVLMALATMVPKSVAAELAVVVHPSNSVASITLDDVHRIYLGKAKKFPGGGNVTPLDQDSGTPAREKFYSDVIGKSEAQAKAYWSKLIFTGKGTPPETSGDDASVKAAVGANPKALGYIDAAALDDSVKVVLRLP